MELDCVNQKSYIEIPEYINPFQDNPKTKIFKKVFLPYFFSFFLFFFSFFFFFYFYIFIFFFFFFFFLFFFFLSSFLSFFLFFFFFIFSFFPFFSVFLFFLLSFLFLSLFSFFYFFFLCFFVLFFSFCFVFHTFILYFHHGSLLALACTTSATDLRECLSLLRAFFTLTPSPHLVHGRPQSDLIKVFSREPALPPWRFQGFLMWFKAHTCGEKFKS